MCQQVDETGPGEARFILSLDHGFIEQKAGPVKFSRGEAVNPPEDVRIEITPRGNEKWSPQNFVIEPLEGYSVPTWEVYLNGGWPGGGRAEIQAWWKPQFTAGGERGIRFMVLARWPSCSA